MGQDDFVGLGLSSRASSSINDPDRLTCIFPCVTEIDWPWHCSICYEQKPQAFLPLNVAGATVPGFGVLLNPLLALVAVSLANAGPAPHQYFVPICASCRPFSLSEIICPDEPTETALGLVSAGNGCVGIAFASSDYSRAFLKANAHLAFPNGEGLADFKAKDNLNAARAERAKKEKAPGWKIDEDRLLKILSELESVKSFFAKPNIPPAKLSTAMSKCEAPASETIVGLADFTTFGSAKRALLFGLEGIYYKGLMSADRLPYSEFPSCVFGLSKSSPSISAGEKKLIPLGHFPLLRVFGEIKHAVEES